MRRYRRGRSGEEPDEQKTFQAVHAKRSCMLTASMRRTVVSDDINGRRRKGKTRKRANYSDVKSRLVDHRNRHNGLIKRESRQDRIGTRLGC